jgi:thiol:disulfide interchange protein
MSSSSAFLLWPMLLMVLVLQAGMVSVVSGGGALDSFPYLYATRSNYSASFPVIEYIAPTEASKLNDDRPDFLYDKNQPARIINWYGHWCNTCKNFKPHYVRRLLMLWP